jgi:aldose 1-epimerase
MHVSGDQIELAAGSHRAVVATVGATLREYAVGGRQVVDGFRADEVCPGGRGQILMPWPNRIAEGTYEHAGDTHELTLDEAELGHAIHGLVRWVEWRVAERSADRALFRHRLAARPGYPFPLDLEVEYRVSASGLSVRFAALNIGGAPCPFGAGAHPYFGFAGTRVDALELHVPAGRWLQVDARSVPLSWRSVEGSPLDFRRPRPIGPALLDHAFTALERDGGGIARVSLRRGAESVVVWLDRSFDFVQVFTGDTLPDRARRRFGAAIEPMSCAPNAFNTGQGMLVLAPGESFEGRWGVGEPDGRKG